MFAVLFATTLAGVLPLAALGWRLAASHHRHNAAGAVRGHAAWKVAGFWNAVIGFLIVRLAADPMRGSCRRRRASRDEPVTASTAILLCIRNELPERMIAISSRCGGPRRRRLGGVQSLRAQRPPATLRSQAEEA